MHGFVMVREEYGSSYSYFVEYLVNLFYKSKLFKLWIPLII